MTYVESIEPRLTPIRPASPARAAEVLAEWTQDLCEELSRRLELMSSDDLSWRPHPDANDAGVTVWHVARWLDVLATRAFTGGGPDGELWVLEGWRERTSYDPTGIGFRGLGVLTGYTAEQMRAVPRLTAAQLTEYLGHAAHALISRIRAMDESVHQPAAGLSPYQQISATLQGSFGHVGEIDTLVALRARLGGTTAE